MKKYILSHPYFCVDRYGSVFKSHILGCPTVISMDQELNKYILKARECVKHKSCLDSQVKNYSLIDFILTYTKCGIE